MNILKNYNYESSNGSEIFYNYFFNKVGIGADPNKPFTKFLELIIDCFYNNSIDLSNLLYDGVLTNNTANNLDEELRTNWLNKLGTNYNLPNIKGLIPQYKEKEFLTNDEYNHYLYLRNCNLRTLKDWKTNFDKCFLTEKHTDITSRLNYVNNNLVLNYSEYDTVMERWFMNLIFKYLCEYNLIEFNEDNDYVVFRDDLNDNLLINYDDDNNYINRTWVCDKQTYSVYSKIDNGVMFVNYSGGGNLRSIKNNLPSGYYDTTYYGDFIINFKIKIKINTTNIIRIGLVDNNNEWITYKTNKELGLNERKYYNIRLVRDNENISYYVDDLLVDDVLIEYYNNIKLNIVFGRSLPFVLKDFRGYNIPKY